MRIPFDFETRPLYVRTERFIGLDEDAFLWVRFESKSRDGQGMKISLEKRVISAMLNGCKKADVTPIITEFYQEYSEHRWKFQKLDNLPVMTYNNHQLIPVVQYKQECKELWSMEMSFIRFPTNNTVAMSYFEPGINNVYTFDLKGGGGVEA